MALFAQYHPAQRERLRAQMAAAWDGALVTRRTLERARAAMRTPPAAPSQLSGAASYLIARNRARVQALVRDGAADEQALLRALADWRAALDGDDAFPLLFLGLALTLDCSFSPRCLYCNQAPAPPRMTPDAWKAILTEAARPIPPYVYLTGGEPLLLGDALWGDDGVAAFAVRLGCAVNVNTNASLITPHVAIQLVKTGVAKAHVSLDSADPRTQDALFQGPGRTEAVWRGIRNLQIARELLGAAHPQIHVNCVLTRRNLLQVPRLLRQLLRARQVRSEGFTGKLTEDPAFGDFAFHLIPVGGEGNAALRPTEEEWRRFYAEVWDEAERGWGDYQEQIGVPPEERKTLAAHVPFANPFLRVDHRMTLEQYCRQAARGAYWQGALMSQCYLAPSQAFVLPDGSQHWCGAHAIRRVGALGTVVDGSLRGNIRRRLDRLEELPGAACAHCAGATCAINQRVEAALTAQLAEWLTPPPEPAGRPPARARRRRA